MSAPGAAPDRRARGVYYTPPALVDLLLRDVPARVDRLIDPSCGQGAFLLGALRLGVAGAPAALWGVDRDPDAIAHARAALPGPGAGAGAHLRSAEALTMDWPELEQSFDAVVGNPPFVDSETMTRTDPALRRAVRARSAAARGNWDLAFPFVELALRLVRPGGVVAMVLPRQAFASDGAAALQDMLLERTIVAVRTIDAHGLFDGAGAPLALLTLRASPPSADHRVVMESLDPGLRVTRRVEPAQADLRSLPRGFLLAPLMAEPGTPMDRCRSCAALADVATLRDGATTAEAYALRDALRDATPSDAGAVRLINTGAIEPFATLWGERPTTYLRRRLLRPVIDDADLRAIAPRQAGPGGQAGVWKVGVAGLARRLEGVVLPPGTMASKSTVLVLPREGVCAFALAALLNAPSTTLLYRALFGGRGFGAGALHIGPRQLERLPIPTRGAPLAPGGELSRLGERLHALAPGARASASDADLDAAVARAFENDAPGTMAPP